MIREAKLGDLEQVLGLLHQLSPTKKRDDKKELRRILNGIIKDRNYVIAVYEEDKKLLGTATLLIQLNLSHNGKPYGHVENVVTDKNSRGNGIGKELVEYLIEKANKRKCYKVILDCVKPNIPFYKKCRFAETGEVEMRLNLFS